MTIIEEEIYESLEKEEENENNNGVESQLEE